MLGLKEWQQLEKFKSRLIGVFEGGILWEWSDRRGSVFTMSLLTTIRALLCTVTKVSWKR